jgi:Family of unknown function (DUF5677)
MPIAIEPPQEDQTNFEFDADGFLTDRRCTLESNIGRAHGRFFTRARQINRDCHELLFAAPIHNRDSQEILSATLFTRALEHYQATLILLSTGLVAPAKVTLRALLECVLTTRTVAADPDALRAFINDDLLQRRKLIRRAQQHDHPNLQELRQALSSDVIEGLEQQIEDSGAKSLKTEELSKLADMHDWYTTNYALLSKATHSNVRQLEAYLSLDESGEIRGFTYAPSIEEIPQLVLTAAHCILLAAEALAGTFEIDFGDKISEHRRYVEAGFESLNGNSSLREAGSD